MIVDFKREWLSRATCRGMDPETFFTDHSLVSVTKNEPSSKVLAQWLKAKKICATCPVRLQCARAHLGETEGVWGGLDPVERKELREKYAAQIYRLTGPLKAEYAEMAYRLKNHPKLTLQDVTRLMGLPASTVRYLADWHEEVTLSGGSQAEEAPLTVEEIPRPRGRAEGVSRAYGTAAIGSDGNRAG